MDELWVFGRVLFEILLAKDLGKPIRFFTIDNRADKIKEITPRLLRFERKVYQETGLKHDGLVYRILGYDPNNPPPKQLYLFFDQVNK